MNTRSPLHKILTIFMVVFASVTVTFGPVAAQPARAQGAVTVVDDLGRQLENILDEILTALTRAGVVAFFNAAQTFFGQLAYDAANYVASGGKGQGALVYEKGFGDYIADVASDAAGDFIGSLSDDSFFETIGFDLCRPPNPEQLLNIQLSLGNFFPGLQGNFERPRPSCDFQEVISNYEQLYTTLSNSEITDYINANLSPAGNELGISASIFGRSFAKISSDTAKKQLDRTETGGFKAVEGVISGNVKTPAAVVQREVEAGLVEQPKADEGQKRNIILQNAFEEGPIQLAIYTASVFLNTLGSKLMNRIFEEGIVGAFDFSSASTQIASVDSVTVAGATDARKANIDLRDINLIRTSNVEIISELIACPQNRGLWNCVVDQALAQAIQSRGDQGNVTIQEALANDFLHGGWRLLPTTFAREHLDPQCYTYAYCSGNMQKLRVLRILPVGFELAANSEENLARCATASGCATLDEVVDGFSDCNDAGQRDADHPWCKMIDPNWVITSFPQQCQLTGYSETLLTGRLPQRQQQCQDVQTCLQRNDNGECVGGYGYCLAERTSYRFNANECPANYASCRNFTSRSGQRVSYMRNTLDYSVCGADNVGCLGYFTERNPDGSWVGTTTTGDTIYFDATVQPCSATDDGCTKLIAAEVGQTSLNIALNPSFERTAGEPAEAVVWEPLTAPVTTVSDGNASFHGSASLPVAAGGGTVSQRVSLEPGRIYAISAYFRTRTSAGSAARIDVQQIRANGTVISNADQAVEFRSSGCVTTGGNNIPRIAASGLGTDWQRLECTFLTTSATAGGRVDIVPVTGDVLVDAVQLEAGEFATDFVDGYNVSLPVVHMKVPPDDLQCTGADTDSPLCGNYAKVCRQVDAGCQGYTDVAGGPEVPAILSSNDLCPESCVGYSEYRKAASAFDFVQSADARFSDPTDATSSYFIADTGQLCSQQDVGCELFTNVGAAAEGGEQAQAFNYLRSCQQPSDQSQTYFTWEGSDTSGFQLRTWSLVSEAGAGTGPRILLKAGPDGIFKEPTTCDEGLWRSGVDPDCRQFYNSAGDVFYRYFTHTVLSTEQCTSWRLPRTNENDCTKSGGAFSPSTGECTYQVYVPESRTCRAQFAGCRAFMGAGSGNVQTVLQQSFRDGAAPFESGAESSESLLVGDSSLRVDPSGGTSRTSVVFASEPEGLYEVSFWAKAPARNDVVANVGVSNGSAAGGAPQSVGAVRLGADWQRFTVGIFNAALSSSSTRLTWTFTGDTGGAPTVFIDEVFVNRITDVAYVVNTSWNTPIECDRSPAGTPQPQAMLGCRAYTDRFSNRVNAFRFTRLCRAEAIGCRAFIDTRNSDSVGAETFVMSDASPIPRFNDPADAYPAATTTRAADRMTYLIYDQSKLCQPENASCRAFGKPQYAQDRQSFVSVETVYFKDDITKYSQALCRPSEQFCEEYNFGGSRDYFRDPQDHVCEYKEAVRLSCASFPAGDPLSCGGSSPLPSTEVIYSGWFRQGTTYPCYPGNLEGGRVFGMSRRGDVPYSGWVGLCPSSSGECTEFRDPNDTSDPVYRESGRPYYFVNNNRLDSTSCAGSIDVARGCILLRNMSDTQLTYSLEASYKKYEMNDFQPTPPVNCAQTPSDPACVATNSTTTDANLILKVNVDRDCAQWLGCQSSETVFDPATNRYKDVCTNLALCNKSSGAAGDIFCANYVDRSTTSTEPILTEGAFFDIGRYASRDVGLGSLDYSGYAIPNSFLVPDLQNVRVGAEGALNIEQNTYRFAQDYRLAAAIPIATQPNSASPSGMSFRTPRSYEARILDGTPIATANPDLNLCQHAGSGLVGYYLDSNVGGGTPATRYPRSSNVYCYLAVTAETDSADFQNVSTKFSLDDPRTDASLSRAFPPPECRAYPEADAPYPASFVTEWDFTANPPKASEKIAGFASANTCEFGEDCVCSYKRADYGSAGSKFFDIFSQNVPPGICVGGPRNGQGCLPSSIFSIQQSSGGLDQGALAANAEQTCGPPEGGGTCIPFSKVEIVRGIFGQCLERDQTRFLGADQNNRPCLTWNPTPILFGDKDPFHYQPTSGYLPPQNSGQYYCTSAVRQPTTVKLTQEHFARFDGRVIAGQPTPLEDYLSDGAEIHDINMDQYTDQYKDHAAKYAGKMTRMEFDEQWVSPDNRCFPDECDFRSPSLLGVSTQQRYPSALRCEATDDSQASRGTSQYGHRDFNALRLVDAGSGYTETFFRIHDDALLTAIGQEIPAGASASTTEDILNNSLSNLSIGYFRMTPQQNGSIGRLACGYQEEWVDNMPAVTYENAELVEAGETQWRREISRTYNPFMTRASEEVLTFPESPDTPVKAPCFSDAGSLAEECYFLTWETGYRNENKPKQFLSLFQSGSNNVVRNFMSIRENPFVSTCEDSKPYFGIRAVFQSPANRTTGASPSPDDIQGPWRFIGFWVTACGGDTGGDQRYIYMNAEMGAVSICRELAEVQSAASKSDAAFTDRVWQNGGFTEPGTGMQYSARSAPFSSALNTDTAGKDPLFQAGFELAGFSPLNPPTFLQPGVQTYYREQPIPRDKYAFLTNLFGRIYRVYRFHIESVTKDDTACLEGPFKGTSCVAGATESGIAGNPACSVDGTCEAALLSPADRFAIRYCEGGGISNLALCGQDPEVCKAPSFVDRTGTTQSAFARCIAAGTDTTRCADGAVNTAVGSCTVLTDGPSTECPVALSGSCESVGTPGVGSGVVRRCNLDNTSRNRLRDAGIEVNDDGTLFFGRIKACSTDDDCRFTAADVAAGECRDASAGTQAFGRCRGGLKDSALCMTNSSYAAANLLSCIMSEYPSADKTRFANSCGPVSSGAGDTPVAACRYPGAAAVPNTSDDPDSDNNICTHGGGYVPRLDICPNPDDEYCGLISYKITSNASLNPRGSYPAPTDVTLGHYTPYFLGWPGASGDPANLFDYMAYYTPRPPRLAAPDTRNCPIPGQCPISTMDAFNFNGQAEGVINVGGGQHKSYARFYAWASHNQMPLRQIVIDWGDGSTQRIDEAKLKNRKPFCGVQRECSDPIRGAGLTCQTDADCPAGTGQCLPVGTCNERPHVSCFRDSDCTYTRTGAAGSPVTVQDTCDVRTLFGNSGEACQKDYFDFNHVYTCGAAERTSLPACRTDGRNIPVLAANECYFGDGDSILGNPASGFVTRPTCSAVSDCQAALDAAGWGALPAGSSCGAPAIDPTALTEARCSRDPNRTCSADGDCAPGDTCIATGLAPVGGCFDETTNSCRFTPRVLVQDNWGWCTGECRNTLTGGQPDDLSTSNTRHPYGGCYAAQTLNSVTPNVRLNDNSGALASRPVGVVSECSVALPDSRYRELRPWIVYPGSLQLRFSGESSAP